MKICQVSSCYYPAWAYGGQAKVAYEITKRLAKRGHELTVYTTDAMDDGHRLDKGIKNIDGVNVYYFRNVSNLLAWKQRITISPEMISVVKNEIERFDIIHIHGFRDFQSCVIHHYAQKYGIPYIIQPHGSVPLLGKKKAKKVFDYLFGQNILNNSARILALNEIEEKTCMEMGLVKNNIKMISNGIDLSEYGSLPAKGLFKKCYNLKENDKIILYLGRIHKNKGLDILVRAFAKTLEEINDVKLVIAGTDDGYLLALEQLTNSLNIKNKVLFTGFLNQEEKIMAYVDSEVFVTPSFTGFPLTFLEAMALGVPIITTNKWDVIKGIDNWLGYVVEYNEKSIKNALMKILLDEKLRDRLQRNCRHEIIRYEWDTITDEIERIYKSVLT